MTPSTEALPLDVRAPSPVAEVRIGAPPAQDYRRVLDELIRRVTPVELPAPSPVLVAWSRRTVSAWLKEGPAVGEESDPDVGGLARKQ